MTSSNHLALVTGAAGTMGRAVVEALVEAGVRVAAVDINRDGLEPVVAAGRDLVTAYTFDISDPDAVHAGVRAIAAELGPIDILVNNAGILSNNKAMTTTPEEWNRIMAINLNGAFYLTREVLPAMREAKWGRIINTSSFAAKSGGLTAGTAYSVSKAAIIGLTFSIAAETTRDGITVNGIAPAYVRTPMVTEQLTAEQRAEIEAKIPVGRFCEPEEFAHTVMFLASEQSGFITGEIIDMNGGFQFD
ncbi:MAG TPA: SDR family oxidoreductase [Spirochaetia bacterium]|nr:SDR family oxidoreductase [Spirochaetia bacterium]